MTKLETKIKELLEEIIINLGYELYDVEYIKEGKDYFLRIYIDSNMGITLEDCEKVSNSISDILDESNYIKDQYFLEVSSPGIERNLRENSHFKSNIGKMIEVKLFRKIENKKDIVGVLEGFDDEYLILNLNNNQTINIERSNISLVKTVYNW